MPGEGSQPSPLKWCQFALLAAGAVSCQPVLGKPWDRGLVVSFHILKQKMKVSFLRPCKPWVLCSTEALELLFLHPWAARAVVSSPRE